MYNINYNMKLITLHFFWKNTFLLQLMKDSTKLIEGKVILVLLYACITDFQDLS